MGACQTVESAYDVQYKRHGCKRATGEGASGKVHPCNHRGGRGLRAVKTIEKTDWSVRSRVLAEIQILQAVTGKHPNIVQFFEYFEEWSEMNLIFEYCPKGTLEEAFEGGYRPSEAAVAPLAHQIAGALALLHSQGIMHRDVKPANLLFADDVTLKLADFGSAHSGLEPVRQLQGTPAFFAPEQQNLHRGEGYSLPVDAWAMGVALYMMLCGGVHPFEKQAGGYMDKHRLLSGDFDAGWFTSSRAADLLEWLLMPHPSQRIRLDEALRHKWFSTHRLGCGSFAKDKPGKMVLDSHGNWMRRRG